MSGWMDGTNRGWHIKPTLFTISFRTYARKSDSGGVAPKLMSGS